MHFSSVTKGNSIKNTCSSGEYIEFMYMDHKTFVFPQQMTIKFCKFKNLAAQQEFDMTD